MGRKKDKTCIKSDSESGELSSGKSDKKSGIKNRKDSYKKDH